MNEGRFGYNEDEIKTLMSEGKHVFIVRKQSGTQKYWSEGLTFTSDPNKAQRFLDEQHARELLQEAGKDLPSCEVILLDETDLSGKKVVL